MRSDAAVIGRGVPNIAKQRGAFEMSATHSTPYEIPETILYRVFGSISLSDMTQKHVPFVTVLCCNVQSLFGRCRNYFVYINILLTVHLNLFILVINLLDAQNLYYNKFISCLKIFRAPCAHRHEVKIYIMQPLVSSHL